ncbi:MAG: cytochrome b [Gammaproteobacteria bacterium]|nr:cytochrome b [Gammaproteobacteria bacterium]
MQLYNSFLRYGFVAKTFHWVMFVVIVFLLLVDPLTDSFPRGSDQRFFIVWLHQSLGLTVFMLVIMRLLWKWINPKPTYPESMPIWQQRLSSVVHGILYTLILLQPIAGVLTVISRGRDAHFFGIFSIPGFEQSNDSLREVAWFLHHDIFGKALMGFILFHLLASLYHHFIVKDNILKKMTWGA